MTPSPKLSSDQPIDYSRSYALTSPEWVKDAVIYQIYLRAFSESEKFHSIESRFPDLKALGVTCLYLLPIHPIGEIKKKGSLGSPYSVKDYTAVHLAYGTKDGFKSFVEEAHTAGFKVIIDWVANHSAWDNPLIKSHPEWYLKDASGQIRSPNEDWTDTAALDYSSTDLRHYMKETMTSWVKDYDIDGFRCDVADLVPLDFWEDVRKHLRVLKPEILMLAEGDQPQDHLKAFNLTYALNFYDALIQISQEKMNSNGLWDFLERETALYPQGSLRLRFTENHDKQRAKRFLGAAHKPLAALLLTLDGVPLIYNGQEIGEERPTSLFEKELIDWERGSKELKKFYKKLIHFRSSHPCLSRGQRFRVSSSNDEALFVFASSYRDDAVLVALNLSSKEFSGTLDVPNIFRTKKGELNLKALFSDHDFLSSSPSDAKLNLPPWGVQIWEIK